MTEILRQKIIKLVRGEEGVALVVTLALFMFLYVSCAGVYSIGRAVKDRIILQNAVDAAAYSAAVVQADYLSRIATINKAMAWNYAQLLKSQKNWIVLRFLKEVDSMALAENKNDEGVNIKIIAGDKELSLSKADLLLNTSGKSLKTYESDIDKYAVRLLDLYSALHDEDFGLTKRMEKEVRDTVDDILAANLPFRIGELCRKKVKVENVLIPMDAKEEERRFLSISLDDDSFVGDGKWYEFSDDGDGFKRDVLSEEKLWAQEWQTSNDGLTWFRRDPIDAYDFVSSELPRYGSTANPLTIAGGFFLRDGAALGSITVAVAKWNENSWKGLIDDKDLAKGIHAVFNHAEKNDWTFAIASAQAGYRSNTDIDARKKGREYSLNGEDFDFVKLGKEGEVVEFDGQDWDALYLPVRKAFKDGAAFKEWLTSKSGDDDWKPLVEDRKYVSGSLADISFDDLNHKALSRMHNNSGANQVLRWDGDGIHEFLDLMYH